MMEAAPDIPSRAHAPPRPDRGADPYASRPATQSGHGQIASSRSHG